MARLRFLMNEGDVDFCAFYVDNKLTLTGDADHLCGVEEVLPKLVGLTIESISIEYTNLPFFDDDENPIEDQQWPATIGDLPEE